MLGRTPAAVAAGLGLPLIELPDTADSMELALRVMVHHLAATGELPPGRGGGSARRGSAARAVGRDSGRPGPGPAARLQHGRGADGGAGRRQRGRGRVAWG